MSQSYTESKLLEQLKVAIQNRNENEVIEGMIDCEIQEYLDSLNPYDSNAGIEFEIRRIEEQNRYELKELVRTIRKELL